MRHAGTAVYVHVVWATWDRLPLLVGEVEQRVQRAIGAKCAEFGAEIIALGGMEDHVHLLVRLPAAVSLAILVGQVKGASAHLITHEVLRDGEFFKWQGAYGAVSVSPRHLPIVANYITHQREHHAAGSLIEALEPPPMPMLRAAAKAPAGETTTVRETRENIAEGAHGGGHAAREGAGG